MLSPEILFPEPIHEAFAASDDVGGGFMKVQDIVPQFHSFMVGISQALTPKKQEQGYDHMLFLLKSGGPLRDILLQLSGAYGISHLPNMIAADFAQMAEISDNPWVNGYLANAIQPGQKVLIVDEYRHHGHQEKMMLQSMGSLFPKSRFSFLAAFSDVPYWRDQDVLMGMQDRRIFHQINEAIDAIVPGKRIKDYGTLPDEVRRSIQGRLDANLVKEYYDIDYTLNGPKWSHLKHVESGIQPMPLPVTTDDRTNLDHLCYFAAKMGSPIDTAALIGSTDWKYYEANKHIYYKMLTAVGGGFNPLGLPDEFYDPRERRQWLSRISLASLPIDELDQVPAIISAPGLTNLFYDDIKNNLCPQVLQYSHNG